MSNKVMWAAWAIIPVVAAALHFGPGQKLWAKDRAASVLSRALAAEEAGQWETAAELYASARTQIPEEDRATAQRVQLAEARTKAWAGDLTGAGEQLRTLLNELMADASANASSKPDESLLREVRSELASTSYATAWQMRIEGAAADEWMAEAEESRQQYRLLAEEGVALAPEERMKLKENLEAVLRFEDLDDSELKGMKMPSKCKNCKGGVCQKKRDQRSSKKKEGKPKDAREEINKNAGDGAYQPKGS